MRVLDVIRPREGAEFGVQAGTADQAPDWHDFAVTMPNVTDAD
jgi:hypothetical protein